MTGGAGVGVGDGVGLGVGVGVGVPPPGGMTNNVMLCEGTFKLKLVLTFMSLSRVIEFADVSCQTCANPEGEKFAMFTLAFAAELRFLLMIMTVSAPSLERTAAKADSESGSGTVAWIL